MKKGETLKLYDKGGVENAVILVTSASGTRVHGKVLENRMSAKTKAIFKEFQHLAENQVFSLLDRNAVQIETLGLNLGKGQPPISGVQIFDDMVSFKMGPYEIERRYKAR